MSGTTTVRGSAIVLPKDLRERLGPEDGTVLAVESDDEGIHLRPLDEPEIKIYVPERTAEFILSNTMDEADYAHAVGEVRQMGLDPEAILHLRPDGSIR